jgi:hypothetical protein
VFIINAVFCVTDDRQSQNFKALLFFFFLTAKMGTPQENFDQGVKLRLAGNEAFKKQDYKGCMYK